MQLNTSVNLSRACPRIEPNKNQNRANPTPMPRTFTRFVCAPPTHMLPPLTHQPTRHRNTQHRTRLLCCVEFCLPTRDPSDFAWNFIAFRQDGRRPQCSSASRGKERGGSNGHGQKGRGWRQRPKPSKFLSRVKTNGHIEQLVSLASWRVVGLNKPAKCKPAVT